MCIAIMKPANVRITKECLEECYRCNRDGAGFAYYRPDIQEVCIVKGFFSFDKFWTEYEKYQDLKCLIHFRVATHKNIDGKNCHPWRVIEEDPQENKKGIVFIHNGTIPGMSANDSFSDTGNFCDDILKPLFTDIPDAHLNSETIWLLNNSIGKGNKLVFLDNEGNHTIINESAGTWVKDIWFSNTSFEMKKADFKVIEGGELYNKPVVTKPTVTTKITPNTSAAQVDDAEVEAALKNIREIGMHEFEGTPEEADALLRAVNAKNFAHTD